MKTQILIGAIVELDKVEEDIQYDIQEEVEAVLRKWGHVKDINSKMQEK